MPSPSLALLGALLIAGTGVAQAADATPAPLAPLPPPPPVRGGWYGGTVLAVDGVMIAAGAGCLALSGDSERCLLPIYGYLLCCPIIHGRHQGWGRAFASVGLRLGLPLLGLLVGLNSGSSCRAGDMGDYCGLEAASHGAVGLAVGMGAAIAIDAAWAYDDAPAPTPPRPLDLTPAFSLGPNGGGVGLQGIF